VLHRADRDLCGCLFAGRGVRGEADRLRARRVLFALVSFDALAAVRKALAPLGVRVMVFHYRGTSRVVFHPSVNEKEE